MKSIFQWISQNNDVFLNTRQKEDEREEKTNQIPLLIIYSNLPFKAYNSRLYWSNYNFDQKHLPFFWHGIQFGYVRQNVFFEYNRCEWVKVALKYGTTIKCVRTY